MWYLQVNHPGFGVGVIMATSSRLYFYPLN
jgi:hypothetical protein